MNRLKQDKTERLFFENAVSNQGVTSGISRGEAIVAVQRVKSRKATGPDEISIKVWKCLCETEKDMLWDLMQQTNKENMPNEWR